MKYILNENDEAVIDINGKDIIIKKMKFSPDSAKLIIENSDKVFQNRKSNPNTYSVYLDDMENNNWKTNGETIKFDKEGALIDGRNRLSAVSIGNKDMDFLAVCNIERDTVDTIDIGLKRSLEHVLKIQEGTYKTGTASIVRSKLMLDTGRISVGASDTTLKLSRLNCVKEYEENVIFYNGIAGYVKNVYNDSCGVLGKTEVGAIYAHLVKTLKWDENIVQDFFNKLEAHEKKSIFFTTYDKLINKKICRLKDRYIQYMICWNSFVLGKRTLRISYKEGDWFLKPTDI